MNLVRINVCASNFLPLSKLKTQFSSNSISAAFQNASGIPIVKTKQKESENEIIDLVTEDPIDLTDGVKAAKRLKSN